MNEETLTKDIETARTAALRDTTYAKTQKVKDLQAKLQDHLAQGAKACKRDKDHRIIGMLKRPSFIDRDQIEQPPLYEVGCSVCPERSRANTAKEAVSRWNAGKYIK
jgi:hypothetical protein